MTEIVSDVVVSLFAVIGLIFIINEISNLFGKSTLDGTSVYVVCPGKYIIDSEYILNLTKTVSADKYIIVSDTDIIPPVENVSVVNPSGASGEINNYLSAIL